MMIWICKNGAQMSTKHIAVYLDSSMDATNKQYLPKDSESLSALPVVTLKSLFDQYANHSRYPRSLA